MAINQDLLRRIEASADAWGPAGMLGNEESSARAGKEDDSLDERLGLHPISIRFPKELVRDMKAIAQLNGMSYQPLIREICRRFVEAEKRAILRDRALRLQQELQREQELTKQAQEAAAAAEQAAQLVQAAAAEAGQEARLAA